MKAVFWSHRTTLNTKLVGLSPTRMQSFLNDASIMPSEFYFSLYMLKTSYKYSASTKLKHQPNQQNNAKGDNSHQCYGSSTWTQKYCPWDKWHNHIIILTRMLITIINTKQKEENQCLAYLHQSEKSLSFSECQNCLERCTSVIWQYTSSIFSY